ncbi:MAG: hypothetical protein ACK5IB_07160 [Qingshengfaniella sp.]
MPSGRLETTARGTITDGSANAPIGKNFVFTGGTYGAPGSDATLTIDGVSVYTLITGAIPPVIGPDTLSYSLTFEPPLYRGL